MRSKREIKDRVKQASFRYLKTILGDRLNEVPHNCGHNEGFELEPDVKLGMCGIFDETGVRICDSRLSWCLQGARGCDWFVHRQTKEEIKAEWAEMFEAATDGKRVDLVRAGYGDLAALLWALDEDLDLVEGEPVPTNGELKGDTTLQELVNPSDETVDGVEPLSDEKKPGFWNRLFGG